MLHCFSHWTCRDTSTFCNLQLVQDILSKPVSLGCSGFNLGMNRTNSGGERTKQNIGAGQEGRDHRGPENRRCVRVPEPRLPTVPQTLGWQLYSLILCGLLPGVLLYTCTHSFSEVVYQGCHCIHVLTRSLRSFTRGVTVYMYSLVLWGVCPVEQNTGTLSWLQQWSELSALHDLNRWRKCV